MTGKMITCLKMGGDATYAALCYLALVYFLLAILAQPITLFAAQDARIVFVDELQPLTLKRDKDGSGKDIFKSDPIPVRNEGDAAGSASFCVLKPQEKKSECIQGLGISGSQSPDENGVFKVAVGEVVQMSVRMSTEVLSSPGYYIALRTLVGTNQTVATSWRPIKGPAPAFPSIVYVLFGIGVVFAIALSWRAARNLKKQGVDLGSRMGTSSWEFSKSWVSNIAIGGAAVSAILGLTLLPDSTQFVSKGYYGILIAFLSLLAGIAPFIYNIFRKPETIPGVDGKVKEELLGYVRSFLFASGLVICAAIAQMATLAMLIFELLVAGLMPAPLVWFFIVVIAILAIGVVEFCSGALSWTAKSQVVAIMHRADTIKSKLDAIEKNPQAVDGMKFEPHPPLPTWAPL